jgi:integrase
MKRARNHEGCVVLDKRTKVWNFYWWENGKRHCKRVGAKADYPTKTEAWRAAKSLRDAVEAQANVVGKQTPVSSAPMVRALVEQFRQERMPQRYSSQLAYRAWLDNHVLPRWGDSLITELQPRPVQLWLERLPLSPKSRVHVRGIVHALWDYAQWRGDVPVQRNPMTLVRIVDASKRTKQPRSLDVEEFQKFIEYLQEPFRTIALICACAGLRISEALGLQWQDVDWLNGRLHVCRGIVRQRVAPVKTIYSERTMPIGAELLETLKHWRRTTQFEADGDWIFASPVQLGGLPWSYPQVWRLFQKAAEHSGIGKLGTHTMRHSYRSWLDAVGTPLAVQQRLMRHADIRTTMNVYGDVVTDEMERASAKVAGLALKRQVTTAGEQVN